MTISGTTNRASFTGAGTTGPFSFPYTLLAQADLVVLSVLNSTGAATTLALNTDYTLAGTADSVGRYTAGVDITTIAAVAVGRTLVAYRDPTLTQALDLVENDPLPAEELEKAYDRVTLFCQRLADRVARVLHLGDSVTAAISTTLPAASAGKALKWAADGLSLTNSTADIDTAVADSAASAAAAASSATTATNQAAIATADVVLTHADVVLTHADVVLTHADVVLTHADVVTTGVSAAAAAASATAADTAAQAAGVKWAFDSSTSMADPGTGDLRMNDATVASVTAIAVSASSSASGNPDLSDYVATWGASTATIKGTLLLRKSGTPATFAIFSVTAAVTDNSTWLQLTVSHVASSGAWSAADVIYAAFVRTGNNADFMADGSVPMTGDLQMTTGKGVIFEGATNDAFEVTLTGGDPTSDITIALPNLAGTLSITGAETWTGNKTLAENVGVYWDDVLSADGKYTGFVKNGTSSAALAFGEGCYRVTATGKWALWKADVVGTSINELGMCVLAAAGADAPTVVMKLGSVRADALFDTFTVGAPLYISAATAGKTVSAKPSGTTDFVVRAIGQAEDANTVFFNPSPDYITLA
ncbi:MAG: hypothetical protein V4641_03435 [Pseudomonadota bacterium]